MAATKQKIFQICPQCHGTKVIPISEEVSEGSNEPPIITTITCNQCDGEGQIEWGYLLVPGP